jgi:hypothetical protein
LCCSMQSNKRLHSERRHTLLFVYQTPLPSGEAQVGMPLEIH